MKKYILIVLLIILMVGFAYGGEVHIDGASYRVLSVEDKTAECYLVYPYVEELNVREVVTIEGEQYTVVAIGDGAASVTWGEHLRTVVLPSTIKRIGHNAFLECPYLTTMQLPEGLEYIGNLAFAGCGFQEIFVPASVSHIGYEAFDGNYLKSLKIDEANTVYDSREDCNAVIETASNRLIIGCQITVVPSTVTSIGPGAFSYTQMTSIELPESVVAVGRLAFGGCYKLNSITIHSPVPPQADEDIIQDGKYNTVVLYVPEGTSANYREAPIWGKFENIVEGTSSIIPNMNTNTNSSECYDLQGRRLSGQPQRGVYIQDGRKILK